MIRRQWSRSLMCGVVALALAFAGITRGAAGSLGTATTARHGGSFLAHAVTAQAGSTSAHTGTPQGGSGKQPKVRHFSGSTSQHKPISFMVSGATLSALRFRVIVSCPSGHRYIVLASRFTSIHIVKSQFHRTFTEQKPSATAKVKGSLRRNQAIGSVWLTRWFGSEHHSCTGSASFKLTAHR